MTCKIEYVRAGEVRAHGAAEAIAVQQIQSNGGSHSTAYIPFAVSVVSTYIIFFCHAFSGIQHDRHS
jgi:hypothetical protein